MTMPDELLKLEQMRERGSLTSDEFAKAKTRLLDTPVPVGAEGVRLNVFRRSRADRWLGGLCGGLAVSTGVDSWIWRLAFTCLFFLGGTGLLVYILFWIFVPSE